MSGRATSYTVTLLMRASFNLALLNSRAFICLNQFEEKSAEHKRNIAKEISERFNLANLQLE